MKWRRVAILAALYLPTLTYAGWEYGSSTDRMDNSVQRWAITQSADLVRMGFPYRDHRPTLTLRTKNGRKLEVILRVMGQVDTKSIDDGELRLKFDNGSPQKWSFTPARGNPATVFIDNEQAFLSRMQNAKTVLIELPFYGQGKKTFAFDITGLDLSSLGMKTSSNAGGKK
jgi:hypothetical protein